MDKIVITKPETEEFTFTLQWLIDLLTRILGDVFGFIYDTEWAPKEK